MAKYKDRTKCRIPTEISKYRPGENAKVRHERRLLENKSHADKLRNWCKSNGFSVDIKNEDMHWIISKGKFEIQWWPNTAKFIVNKKWEKGIHVHDITQVISYLNFAKLLLEQ